MIILDRSGLPVRMIDEYSKTRESTVFSPSEDSFGDICIEMPFGNGEEILLGYFIHADFGDYLITLIEKDLESGVEMICGDSLVSFFKYAVIPSETVFSGTPDNIVADMIQSFADCALPGEISYIELPSGADLPEIEYTAVPGSLMAAISDLCMTYGLGVYVELIGAGSCDVKVAVRTARDARHTSSDPIILSDQHENTVNLISRRDYRNYRNRALVTGMPLEDGSCRCVEVKAENCGFTVTEEELRVGERWVSVKASVPISRYTEEGVFDETKYDRALFEAGKIELAKCRPAISVELEVDEESAERLSVGDICSFRCDELNLLSDALCSKKSVISVGGVEIFRISLDLRL